MLRAPALALSGGMLLAIGALVVTANLTVVGDSGRELGAAEAVVLGVIEGLTEWLPISSTGHLTVTQELLGINGDVATSYAIAIQAGAILAVLGMYRQRFVAMLRGLRGRDPAGQRILVAIAVACLPAAAVGLAFEDVIKERLFGPWPVVAAWFLGGLAILLVAHSDTGMCHPTPAIPSRRSAGVARSSSASPRPWHCGRA